MKRCIILIIITFLTGLYQSSFGLTYYVAATGDDLSDGLSTQSAFRSVAKVNGLTLAPGDSVLFRRGDLFRGMLSIRNSGTSGASIYIGAYGEGALPVIAGTENITGWTASGNIYKAHCPVCPDTLKQIFVNEVRHIPARYPNSGYLTMTNVTTKDFDAKALSQPAAAWDSATLYLRTQHWVIDRFLVKSYTPGHIAYQIPSHFYTSYPLQEYFGFFLSGKLAALDSAGEWYYDSHSKDISLVPVSPSALTKQGAEVSVYRNNIRLADGVKYVVIKDLSLQGSLEDAIAVYSTSYITIHGCSISQSGRDGVGGFRNYNSFNTELTVESCTITDVCNTGINLTGGQDILLHGNTIRRCGLIAGMGEGTDASYEGIYCPHSSKIVANRVDSVGYSAVHVISNDTVMYNYITHYGLTKNDCGGIYFWSGTGNYVAYNIAGNGYGNGEGTKFAGRTMTNGIYSDDNSHDNVIEYNTCYQNETGITIHNTASTTVRNNILYDNTRTQLFLDEDPHNSIVTVHNNLIKDNILQCVHPSQRALYISTEKNNVRTMGSFSGNWYDNPYSSIVTDVDYTPQYSSGNYTFRYKGFTFEEWQSFSGTYADSHGAGEYPSSYATYHFTGNNLVPNSDFSGGTGWWWTYGNAGFSLNADAANPLMKGQSLMGKYANTQSLNPGFWGTAPLQLEKDKEYLLTYTMAGKKAGGLQVAVNAQNAPYTRNMLPSLQDKSFTTGATDDTLLFTANSSIPCSLVFASTSDDGDFNMDNIEVYEVSADTSTTRPHHTTALFVNSSPVPLTFPVAGKYRRLNGTILASDLVLQPYTSVVLRDSAAKVTGIRRSSGAPEDIRVSPNPAADRIIVKDLKPAGNAEIQITDLIGKVRYNALYEGEEIAIPADWENGVYEVTLRRGGRQSVTKLVLSR